MPHPAAHALQRSTHMQPSRSEAPAAEAAALAVHGAQAARFGWLAGHMPPRTLVLVLVPGCWALLLWRRRSVQKRRARQAGAGQAAGGLRGLHAGCDWQRRWHRHFNCVTSAGPWLNCTLCKLQPRVNCMTSAGPACMLHPLCLPLTYALTCVLLPPVHTIHTTGDLSAGGQLQQGVGGALGGEPAAGGSGQGSGRLGQQPEGLMGASLGSAACSGRLGSVVPGVCEARLGSSCACVLCAAVMAPSIILSCTDDVAAPSPSPSPGTKALLLWQARLWSSISSRNWSSCRGQGQQVLLGAAASRARVACRRSRGRGRWWAPQRGPCQVPGQCRL